LNYIILLGYGGVTEKKRLKVGYRGKHRGVAGKKAGGAKSIRFWSCTSGPQRGMDGGKKSGRRKVAENLTYNLGVKGHQ